MGEVYRERERERYRDYRDDPESDEERYRSTTVTRYKVPRGGGYERTTERVVDVDDTGRSHFSNNPRASGDHLDVGGRDRAYAPERPRSAFEPTAHERDRYYDREDRSRVSAYGGSGYQERDRGSDWDRRGREDEVRVEKRTEERFDDARGHEVERIRKETEYYVPQDTGGAPIVIRQRAEPQKIIVQEAPPPAPLVLTRAARDREYEAERQLARRDRDREEDYYRYERREVGPYRGDPRDDDRSYAMSRYDRDRDRDRGRDDDEYYVHRRRVVRRGSSSSSEGHKRELAGGALAGAGITALLSSRRDADGDLPANRGKKVIAGAALGALGTEALKRARSAYGERFGDRDRSPDDHSRLKKGLGIAAVALAAAGAAQYYKANKVEKEESRRGRSRSRRHSHYDDDRSLSRDYYSRTPSRSPTPPRSKSRRRSLSRAATAVLGTAAAAGIVKKLRDRSKSKARSASRDGRSRSRSKSRLRRAAEIGGVAATAGIASKMWKNHREKKAEEKERQRSRSRGYHSSADENDYYRGRRGDRGYSRSRSRSRSRSLAELYRSDQSADRYLGLVEYGDAPLAPTRGYEDEAAERRRRRRLRDRSHSSSASEPEKRSKSRLRNMAAAGAAAIGVNQLMNRKDKDKDDDRRSREREEREQERIRRRSRRRSQGRNYDEEPRDEDYFNNRDRRAAESPPMASGGAYYHPPYPGTPGPAPSGAPYAQFPNPSQPNVNEPQPYYPQDYMGYPPAPTPGPPPPGPPGPPGPPPPGPPPPGANNPPAYVSATAHQGSRNGDGNEALSHPQSRDSHGLLRPEPSSASKSVAFIPLSPKSSQTMQRHLRSQIEVVESDDASAEEVSARREPERTSVVAHRPRLHRRRSSDPTADRSLVRRYRHGRAASVSASDDDVEELPDRFDDDGRPLDGRGHHHRHSWTSRSGEFQRMPRRPGDWDVRGAWHIGGTDGAKVEKLARSFTEALDGRRSWLGVLGEALGGGGLLGGTPDRKGIRDEEEGGRRHR